MTTKTCVKCGVEKPESGFYPSLWIRKSARCIDCFKLFPSVANSKAYYRENRESRLASSKRYRDAHRAEVNAAAAKWRAENPDRVKANWRSWYAKNAERQRTRAREYTELHRDELRAYRQTQRAKELARAWKAANKDKVNADTRLRRARKHSATVEGAPVTVDGIEARCAVWKNACWVCGGNAEEIDHVKPLAVGGLHVLANLRPICMSCNRRKSAIWPFDKDLIGVV